MDEREIEVDPERLLLLLLVSPPLRPPLLPALPYSGASTVEYDAVNVVLADVEPPLPADGTVLPRVAAVDAGPPVAVDVVRDGRPPPSQTSWSRIS